MSKEIDDVAMAQDRLLMAMKKVSDYERVATANNYRDSTMCQGLLAAMLSIQYQLNEQQKQLIDLRIEIGKLKPKPKTKNEPTPEPGINNPTPTA